MKDIEIIYLAALPYAPPHIFLTRLKTDRPDTQSS